MVNLPYATRRLIWIGSSKEDLSAFPAPAKRRLGFALRQVQNGETPEIAKALAAYGSGVFELKLRSDRAAYRVVYVVKLAAAVYVLDAFVKKSKTGRGIPVEIRRRIEDRLKQARWMDRGDLE